MENFVRVAYDALYKTYRYLTYSRFVTENLFTAHHADIKRSLESEKMKY